MVRANPPAIEPTLKIGEVARQAALSIDAVRFYEREGLLRRRPLMKIHLLYFPECPNVDAARAALRDALAAEKLEVPIEEVDVEDQAAPEWARGWGSPTILIDGRDVAGQQPSGSSCCRLYVSGAPGSEVIRAHLAAARAELGR